MFGNDFIKSLKKSAPRLFTINNKNSKQEIIKEFENHFNHLLNTPRIINASTKNLILQLVPITF